MSIMKEDADLMFISFKDTNALDELQSNISSTRPVVTCLGDKWTNPQCFVFVDKQCLWEHEPLTIQEAIQIMFMSYYVFNINYPKELAGILQFIQSCMFDINVEGNKVNRRIFNDKFVPKLLKCMKEYNDYVLKWSN
ncbi:PREDICTED: uncharacterized protein LOC107167799 [Diuraphis noxia]|uniref:uncharacterized protein LOC107167799 n=1 Tax=Diuraphis noxia TaxID=143948 RepID=UPI0007637315|nr:PREDICTED: uncharacterized protein LOC107167799 [Diuraphis noxia]